MSIFDCKRKNKINKKIKLMILFLNSKKMKRCFNTIIFNLFIGLCTKIFAHRYINTQISNLVCLTSFWNNLHQVHSKSKDGTAKYFNVLGGIKQCAKEDSQNCLRSPIPEGGEPQ